MNIIDGIENISYNESRKKIDCLLLLENIETIYFRMTAYN